MGTIAIGTSGYSYNEWDSNRVIDEFKERKAAYVSTDSPGLKGLPHILDILTSPFAYFRMHGRNADKWARTAARDMIIFTA